MKRSVILTDRLGPMYLGKCYLLYNLHFMQKAIHTIYIINSVDKPNYRVSLPHRRSTTVSLETNPLCLFISYFALSLLLKVETHLSSINSGNRRPIKDSKPSLTNSATCSSSTRYCGASTSVTHNFNSSIKTWPSSSNNFKNSSRIILLLQPNKTMARLTGLKLPLPTSPATHLHYL